MDWFRVRSDFWERWFSRLNSKRSGSRDFQSSSLNEVKDFLWEKKYLLSIENKEYFKNGPTLTHVSLAANLNREPSSGLFPQYPMFAHSTDIGSEVAFSRAVGEFVERYSFLIYLEKDLLRASIKKILGKGARFINPLHMANMSIDQVTKDTEFLWTKGINLCTDQETHLPAQLVFWNYDVNHRNWSEPLLRERNSCGLASGYLKEVAIRNALYEVIQRDAFFIYWFNELSPVKIMIDETPKSERFQKLSTWCDSRSVEAVFLDVTADISLPNFLCVLKGQENGQPILSLGFGSGFDVEVNLESALAEAVGLYRWTVEAREKGMESPNLAEFTKQSGWKSVFTAKDRSLMWSREDMREHIAFLFKGETEKLSEMKKSTPTFSGLEEELQFVLGRLAELGSSYEPVAYFSSNPLVKKLSSNAVRVFIPALIPMHMEESGSLANRHPRLRSGAEAMNLKPRAETYPYPHPFP